jgi:nucleotide-binding universal stress UspA family protein
MIQTILVPTDGSEHADKAVAFAADFAQKYDADIILLYVMSDLGTEHIPDELRGLARLAHVTITERDIRQAAANELLRHAEARAREHGAARVQFIIEQGDPTKRILDRAKVRKADLIVMGSRGLGNLKGLLLGSVSHKVSQLAKCTCITVK